MALGLDVDQQTKVLANVAADLSRRTEIETISKRLFPFETKPSSLSAPSGTHLAHHAHEPMEHFHPIRRDDPLPTYIVEGEGELHNDDEFDFQDIDQAQDALVRLEETRIYLAKAQGTWKKFEARGGFKHPDRQSADGENPRDRRTGQLM
eukprot:16450283-Heterocapsa_arctica.AAC.1